MLVRPKPEFCAEGYSNYIQKMLVFSFQRRNYMVIARSSGLVQLYEDAPHESKGKLKNFKLSKEWKNSNAGTQDEIVALGFVSNRYLYTCSSEGKLIFRDLVNDDADQSYKVFLLEGPVSSVELHATSNNIEAIAAGKNNELKLYDIELNTDTDPLLDSVNEDIRILTSELRLTINLTYDAPDNRRTIRRAYLNFRNSFSRSSLVPKFTSSLRLEDYVYTASHDTIANWIISICYVPKLNLVVCGTQFGNLCIYDIQKQHFPIKTLLLSQFPISNVVCFNGGRYALYNDTMSKVGIIDLATFEVVNFYDNLQFGPSMSLKVILNPAAMKTSSYNHVSRFSPIFLIASTMGRQLMIYELLDNNTAKLHLNVQLDTIVPCVDILDPNPYAALCKLFGNSFTEEVVAEYKLEESVAITPIKKRRLSTEIVQCSSPVYPVHKLDDSNEISEMKLIK